MIQGLTEAFAKLDAIPKSINFKVLRYALRQGAKVFQDAIKRNIDGLDLDPQAKKTLKKSLKLKALRTKDGSVRLAVMIKRGNRRKEYDVDAWYYHFIEFGTEERHHKDGSSTGKIEAQPFIRPAVESAKAEAEAAIRLAAREKLIQLLREAR